MKCYTFPPGISRARLYDDSLEPRPMNSRYVVADGSYAIVLFLSKSDGKTLVPVTHWPKRYITKNLNNLHFHCNDLIIKAHLIEHDFINSMNLIVRVKSSKFRLKILHSLADYLSINLISKVSFVKNFWGVFVLDMLALDTSNSVKSSFAKNKRYDRLIKATL